METGDRKKTSYAADHPIEENAGETISQIQRLKLTILNSEIKKSAMRDKGLLYDAFAKES